MSENKFRVVNQPVRKKDAMQLLCSANPPMWTT